MESETNCMNDQNAPPLPTDSSNNNNFKFQFLDEVLCIDNFENIDDHFLSTTSSYDHYGLQSNGYDDPFDPFCHGSPLSFDLYDFNKLWEENDIKNQSFQIGNFANEMEMGTGLSCHHDSYMPLNNVVAPDESSFVTANDIGCHKQDSVKRNKNTNQKNNKSSNGSQLVTTKKKKSKSAKGHAWTMEEDRLLIHLVETYGVKKWSQIAQMVKGRIGKQCRERWHNHLRPDIKKDLWTEDEDRILIETHAEVGNKWAEIAKKLPGRTENSIKNHWNATKRRQFSRRKCRTKWPNPSSLLQNYIKNVYINGKGSTSKSTGSKKIVTDPCPIAEPVIINSAPGIVPEVGFGPPAADDHTVPDFDLDLDADVFTLDDDDIFMDTSSFMDDDIFIDSSSFTDDVPIDEACLDVDMPFDMPPPLMQPEVKDQGLDVFMG